ncbi:MAG TPA: LLM class flavin-dependent oxidoreductase [Baekduia sp.]|nr:LLM class flavin-dependent oxidoreductase [Baekduia sp.]
MKLEFIVVIDNSYVWLPPMWDRESVAIDLPTTVYKSDLGRNTLMEVAENARWAEQLGFDGALFFEQHNNPIGLMGNPMVGAAWLASITSGIRICAVGPILNSYATPVRLAEEIALVDNISNGRLTVGLPMGIGMQYHAVGVMNPSHARARHREANDLLIKAMSEDGPFAWEGEFFNVPYVSLWPRPIQEPFPPIFIPSAGSRETLEMAAKHRYTYQASLLPKPVLLKTCDLFRELCRAEGYEMDPRQIAVVVPVHVAETDAQAAREMKTAATWRYQNVFRFPFHEAFPPGHVSERSLRAMMAGGYRSKGNDPGELTYEELVDRGLIIAGSPSTVIDALTELAGEMGAGRVITMSQPAMPRWLQYKALTMLAQEVVPAFRDADGLAVWQRERPPGHETAVELAARGQTPAGRPSARIDGNQVDVRTAHLENKPSTLPST